MERNLFLWLLLGFGYPLHAQSELGIVRDIFHRTTNETQLDSILNFSWDISSSDTPQFLAYRAASKAMMAEYVFSPFSKLSYFNEGTKELDVLINNQPNVESMYLRLLLQLSAPRFLGYHGQIEPDLKYLIANLPDSSLSVTLKRFFINKLLLANEESYDLTALEQIDLNLRAYAKQTTK